METTPLQPTHAQSSARAYSGFFYITTTGALRVIAARDDAKEYTHLWSQRPPEVRIHLNQESYHSAFAPADRLRTQGFIAFEKCTFDQLAEEIARQVSCHRDTLRDIGYRLYFLMARETPWFDMIESLRPSYDVHEAFTSEELDTKIKWTIAVDHDRVLVSLITRRSEPDYVPITVQHYPGDYAEIEHGTGVRMHLYGAPCVLKEGPCSTVREWLERLLGLAQQRGQTDAVFRLARNAVDILQIQDSALLNTSEGCFGNLCPQEQVEDEDEGEGEVLSA